MKVAAVAELKARLSVFLSRVKAGEEVLVTERNVPVARLVPVARPPRSLAGFRDLERQGLVRLGSGRLPTHFWDMPRPRDTKAVVRQALTQERESGW